MELKWGLYTCQQQFQLTEGHPASVAQDAHDVDMDNERVPLVFVAISLDQSLFVWDLDVIQVLF